MAGIFSVRSNVQDFLRRNFPTESQRSKRMRKAMLKLGRVYIARSQRKFMSGRPGLNRRTAILARTWYYVVTGNRVDGMRLVVWTPTPYGAYHSDVYTPKGSPRRFPIRLPVGAEWQYVTGQSGIADAIITTGYLPTADDGTTITTQGGGPRPQGGWQSPPGRSSKTARGRK